MSNNWRSALSATMAVGILSSMVGAPGLSSPLRGCDQDNEGTTLFSVSGIVQSCDRDGPDLDVSTEAARRQPS